MRLALVPLLGVAALVALVLLAGGRPERTLLERVAAHPERFGSQHVTVTGRVRAIRTPAAYPGAFVLGGPHGRRLLVVPRYRHRLAPAAPGTRIAVQGEVVPLAPRADDCLGRDNIVALGELAERVHARAVLQTGA